MKHVVLPVFAEPFEERMLFHSTDADRISREFFLINRTGENNREIRLVQENRVRSFRIGKEADWYDVIGNVQDTFLRDDYGFQLDAVVDAGGSAEVMQILGAVRKAAAQLGLTMLIRILFLGDIRSSRYEDEQKFYNEIKAGIGGRETDPGNPDEPIQWNCTYMLLAQNPEQKRLRERLLPYLIQMDCGIALHEVKTCGGLISELNISSIETVPRELATRVICSLLTVNDLTNPLPVVLLGKGNTVPKDGQEKLKMLQQALDDVFPVRAPSAMDLLVQKGGPGGEASSGELARRFFRDNPLSDPEKYEKADVHQLEEMPPVADAVAEWEERIAQKTCEYAGIRKIAEMLRPESEFDNLLCSFRNNTYQTGERVITDKDGYTDAASSKLESVASNLGTKLREAVFEARIRLFRARMPVLRRRLEETEQKREKAVQNALSELRNEGVTSLTENWCRKLNNKLNSETRRVGLPGEEEEPAEWIRKQVDELLTKIRDPELDEGRSELARSGDKLMNTMKEEAGQKLTSISLSNTVDTQLPPHWIVYKQIPSAYTEWKTEEPVIIRLDEWYMDLRRFDMMDTELFQRELVPPVREIQEREETVPAEKAYEEKKEETRPLKKEKKELKIYDGTLRWIWKKMDWSSARVEIYEDRGNGADRSRLRYSCQVSYRPNDKYEIGGLEKLPSGSPLYIRVVYQDRGKDVADTAEEIRMQAPKTTLEVRTLTVKEGPLLRKRPYARLKINANGAFSTDHIVVASPTGCVHTASWEQSADGWISELLPDGETWYLANRPGDMLEYEIIYL